MKALMKDKDGVVQIRHINPDNYRKYIERIAVACVQTETMNTTRRGCL